GSRIEDRGSKIEDRYPMNAGHEKGPIRKKEKSPAFDPPSSILDPRSLFLNPRSSNFLALPLAILVVSHFGCGPSPTPGIAGAGVQSPSHYFHDWPKDRKPDLVL